MPAGKLLLKKLRPGVPGSGNRSKNIRACGYRQGREGPGGERGAGLSPPCQKDFFMRMNEKKEKR